MDFDFKTPSTVPQDLLLIQDLIGTIPPPTTTAKPFADPLESSDDSIASTDSEAGSEDEVEADLAPRDEDSGMSAVTSDSNSDSESDTSSSSDSEEGRVRDAPQERRAVDDHEDEESGVATAATYLQTKNEIVDTNIIVPTISEVEACDTLERVGEIMSIVGNIVIVKGLPVDRLNPSSMRALDAESLLVFEDRKVLGYVFETFGPTSQPLYQVKFNQSFPLDTSKVRLSREIFHVPQRSHFVFAEQLKKLRGSDASNIHDEEPPADEIEFSDDEEEAAFKAQRKRRGRSASSSRLSAPAPSQSHINDMVQDTYRGSNPYDAHGPYDDDYHVIGLSRPPPIPYDDPYADVPTSDNCVRSVEIDGGFLEEPQCESGGGGPNVSRVYGQSGQGRGNRNRQRWNTNISGRGNHHNRIASQRAFNSNTDQFPVTSMVGSATWYGQTEDTIMPDLFVRPAPNNRFASEANNAQNYQHFIQPHINPRFASMFGLNLPSNSLVPWASQSVHDHEAWPQHWTDTWATHGNAGSGGEGDGYRPV